MKVTRSVAQVRIPPTVQGMLAARIDRLAGEQKELLQTLAVIGRESPLELINRVISGAGAQLEQRLAALQAGEFIYEEPAAGQVEYTFKHALTQEVAYNSLLIESRKLLHERVGQAMESLYAGRLDDHLEELAHHYSHSDNVSQAVEYLGRAGQQAMRRSAYLEAISNLNSGLEFLMKLRETPERDRQELELQAALGPSLMETKGDSTPEVEAAYGRVAELGKRTGETHYVFWAQGGLFLNRMVRGKLEAAHEIALHLLDLARASDDPAKLLIAHAFIGITLFWTGELTRAHTHFEQAAAHFDPPRQRHTAELYGMDIATGCSGYAALALWMMGYPDQALQRIRRGLALADERNHLSTSAMALHHAAFGHLLRREPQIARELAGGGLALANEHGFGLWAALCTIALGRALAESGQEAEGIAHMEDGINVSRRGGVGLNMDLGALAEAYGRTGRGPEGLRFIGEELAAADHLGGHSVEPELHRIKGELLLVQDPANPGEAERCFRTAIERAQRHAAKSWELRATMSLARLLARQGRRDEARAMLGEIYGWFTEGFDTADLMEAKALLDELS